MLSPVFFFGRYFETMEVSVITENISSSLAILQFIALFISHGIRDPWAALGQEYPWNFAVGMIPAHACPLYSFSYLLVLDRIASRPGLVWFPDKLYWSWCREYVVSAYVYTCRCSVLILNRSHFEASGLILSVSAAAGLESYYSSLRKSVEADGMMAKTEESREKTARSVASGDTYLVTVRMEKGHRFYTGCQLPGNEFPIVNRHWV